MEVLQHRDTMHDRHHFRVDLIFSMEGLFAALFGWWLLDEALSARAMAGCAFMMTGLLVCQLGRNWFAPRRRAPDYLRGER
jgi:drug/metabolite transporter (DMT)-like permease